MITAKEAKALYDESGAEAKALLKTFEPKIIEAKYRDWETMDSDYYRLQSNNSKPTARFCSKESDGVAQ